MNYKGKLYGKVGKSYIPLELTTIDIDAAIEVLQQHAYSQEEFDEICSDDNFTKIKDGFAFDHSIVIKLLGGKLK